MGNVSQNFRNIAFVTLVAALCGCKREPQQAAPSASPPPPGALAAEYAVVSGRVLFQGAAPAPRTITFDTMCGKFHTNTVTESEYRVGDGNGLADVFVHLQGVPEGAGATPDGEAPILDQHGCLYTPKVFGVMVNQKFKIKNSDPLLHNVHAVPKANKEFNFAQPVKNQVNERSFSEPEVLVRIKCDVHPWMNAFVGVVPHKFFAVTDEAGRFALPKGLPAGKYTIEAVHPRAGRVAQEIAVTAGENKPVELTLSAK